LFIFRQFLNDGSAAGGFAGAGLVRAPFSILSRKIECAAEEKA
jgi:hypothetical protein